MFFGEQAFDKQGIFLATSPVDCEYLLVSMNHQKRLEEPQAEHVQFCVFFSFSSHWLQIIMWPVSVEGQRNFSCERAQYDVGDGISLVHEVVLFKMLNIAGVSWELGQKRRKISPQTSCHFPPYVLSLPILAFKTII